MGIWYKIFLFTSLVSILNQFFAKQACGQEIVYPSGIINPFISPDSTVAATTYNNLNSKTKAERDALVDEILKASRVHTIPAVLDISVWNCQHWSMLEIVNSYNWGKDIYNGGYEGASLLYNNYDQFELNQIYANGGTFVDQAKNGTPLYLVNLNIPLLGAEHAMCSVLTGDDALEGKDWNDVEPRDGLTNLQPGEPNTNIPLNADFFILIYPYIFENSVHKKNFGGMRILEFKIVNGEKILTYNINDNPSFNTRMRLITQRESDPPVINIKQGTNPDSLIATVNDANLKSIWYNVDGGAKIPLMTEVLAPVTEKKVAIKMNLSLGTHQITLGADDYFRLSSEQTVQRAIVNTPPEITILSPTEGTEYDKSIIKLVYNITDADFVSASYSMNGGPKTLIGQNGTITIVLARGQNTILIEATDAAPQTVKKSVSFEIMNTTGLEGHSVENQISAYPNPTSGMLTLTYPPEEARIKLYGLQGNQIETIVDKDRNGKSEINLTGYPSGKYIYSIELDGNNYSGKIIKE